MVSQALGGRHGSVFSKPLLWGASQPTKSRPWPSADASTPVYYQVIVPDPNDEGFAQTILILSLLLLFPWWKDSLNMTSTVIINRLQMVIPSEMLTHIHLHQIPLFSHFKILVPKSNQQRIQPPSSTQVDLFRGNASVSLFVEHCLNEAKLPHCDTFNSRIKCSSKQSFSYIITNKHEVPTAEWHLVGGTGFTTSSFFCSQN